MKTLILIALFVVGCAPAVDIPRDDAGLPTRCEDWINPVVQIPHWSRIYGTCEQRNPCSVESYTCQGQQRGEVNNTCSPGICTKTCASVADCDRFNPGQAVDCINNQCRVRCVIDNNCPTAQACIQGVCTPRTCTCPM